MTVDIINTKDQCDVHALYIHSLRQCETLNLEDQEKTDTFSKTHFKVVSSDFLFCVECLYSKNKRMLENTLKMPQSSILLVVSNYEKRKS